MNPSSEPKSEWIFYDGQCGVCHWAVDFVARRDGRGEHFRFAPLFGETFEHLVPDADQRQLPDSLIVFRRDQTLLSRSQGLIHILRSLGGGWKLLGGVIRLVPRPIRDLGYDLFARIRHRLVARPDGTCPLMPPELARRFDP